MPNIWKRNDTRPHGLTVPTGSVQVDDRIGELLPSDVAVGNDIQRISRSPTKTIHVKFRRYIETAASELLQMAVSSKVFECMEC